MAVERFTTRPSDHGVRAGVLMNAFLTAFAGLAPLMVWAAGATALTMAAAVIVERTAYGLQRALNRRVTQRYRPLVQRALAEDDAARGQLLASPARPRLVLAWLMIEPLIEDRDPERIARTREIAQELSVFTLADRYLRSWFLVAPRARAACARPRPGQRPHASDHRRARRCPRRRSTRRTRCADRRARSGSAPGRRRTAARHFPAPRPPAQGLWKRVRAVPARLVRSRYGKPPATISSLSRSAARPGHGPSCAGGSATLASTSAQRPSKRWRTSASTMRPHLWPLKDSRATNHASGR